MEFTIEADANLVLGSAYVADSTMDNCEAYKADLEAIVSGYDGCDEVTITAQVAALKLKLDALECK
jgi:hypothetical protein